MTPQQRDELTEFLDEQEWRWHAYTVVCDTQSGQLISYGRISEILYGTHGLAISPRTIGWFRERLYGICDHDEEVLLTEVPLHRVASRGDLFSLNDSEETREQNDRLRGIEGSLTNPQWR